MAAAAPFGADSEVGRLNKVLVCTEARARTAYPSNHDDLLFDEMLWVRNSKRYHLDFMRGPRDRGVEVVELHDVLAETLAVSLGETATS